MADSDAILPVNEVNSTPAPASSTSLPAGTTNMSRPPGKHDPGAKGARASGQVTTLAGYNYAAMVNYAYQYWSSYNRNYRAYTNDCTNFISQIMYAGGWQYAGTSLGQSDSRRWDYGWFESTTSYTWAGAQNWYQFATGSGRTFILPYASDLLEADVLQIDFDKNYNMNHSMLVTYVSATEKYLTYHTNNTRDRSLTSILQVYPAASNWYYGHRT